MDLILSTLEKSTDQCVRLEDFVAHPERYAYGGWDYPLKKSSLSVAFKRLQKGGLIELVSDQKIAFRLTDKGREKAILSSLVDNNEKWDGKWRLIIFDVPEKRRATRDVLRRKLKDWQFVQLQQSVWGTKKNCTKILRNFIKSVGIEDWVMVVEVNDIGRDS